MQAPGVTALNGHKLCCYLNSQAAMPASITPSSMSGQPSGPLVLYAR